MVIDLRVAAGIAVARQHLPNTPRSVLHAIVEQIVTAVDAFHADESELFDWAHDGSGS